MNNSKLSTKTIAICGVMSALSALVMIAGGFIPISTFAAPAIAGLLLVPAAIDIGEKSGYLIFLVVSTLSLVMVADKEMAFVFIFFFGYYPILKSRLDKIKKKILQWIAKLAIFNASLVVIYGLLIFVFKLEALVSEFQNSGTFFIAAILVLANVMFCIYDMALTKIIWLYIKKYKSRINKSRSK